MLLEISLEVTHFATNDHESQRARAVTVSGSKCDCEPKVDAIIHGFN